MYVANVLSGCCKSRSSVAHVVMAIHTCFKCFICFRRILQVFHLNVSKVNLGRANVAMVALAGGQWLAIVVYMLLLMRRRGSPRRLLVLLRACRHRKHSGFQGVPRACVGIGKRVACVGPKHGSSIRTDAASRAGLVWGEGSTCVRGSTIRR